jgi:hypothetical protein
MATSLTRIAPKRQQSPWRKRRYIGAQEKERGPGHPSIAAQWSTPSVASEVRALLAYMRNTGATVQEMFDLIGVTDREYLELCQWAADKPTIAGALDSMLIFRDEILKHFKAIAIVEGGEDVQDGHRQAGA